eukprot:11202259-Lingulodinium_polyedra.AAC.1
MPVLSASISLHRRGGRAQRRRPGRPLRQVWSSPAPGSTGASSTGQGTGEEEAADVSGLFDLVFAAK